MSAGWGAGSIPAMTWKRIRAYVMGSIDEELLARNEYPSSPVRVLNMAVCRGIWVEMILESGVSRRPKINVE